MIKATEDAQIGPSLFDIFTAQPWGHHDTSALASTWVPLPHSGAIPSAAALSPMAEGPMYQPVNMNQARHVGEYGSYEAFTTSQSGSHDVTVTPFSQYLYTNGYANGDWCTTSQSSSYDTTVTPAGQYPYANGYANGDASHVDPSYSGVSSGLFAETINTNPGIPFLDSQAQQFVPGININATAGFQHGLPTPSVDDFLGIDLGNQASFTPNASFQNGLATPPDNEFLGNDLEKEALFVGQGQQQAETCPLQLISPSQSEFLVEDQVVSDPSHDMHW